MNQQNDFRMSRPGQGGSIEYKSGDKKLEIYWEMSGVSDYDILVAPIDLKEWAEPEGVKIPIERQLEILQEFRAWSKKQNLKTDIDLPIDLNFDDQP